MGPAVTAPRTAAVAEERGLRTNAPPRRRVVLIAGGGTGGHLMPALAIAETLRIAAPHLEPVLVGATRGVEARVLRTRDFRYHLLPAEPIYRRTWWKNARWPLIAARMLGAVGRLYAAEKPLAVLGTGGYASGPVVWFARGRGIPSAVQEQNAYPGLATRWLARRVNHIYLGLPEAKKLLKPGKATELFDTGNPIVPPDPSRREAGFRRFSLDGTRPVILITGGSQGALAINRSVAEWIRAGGQGGAVVIWVTGRGTHAEFAPFHSPPDVHVIDFLDPMADAYAVSDLVLSRAGMITVAEICAWGLPSVLVPLPTAAADHQTHNARAMAEAGAAAILTQADMLRDGVGGVLGRLLSTGPEREAMAASARARGRPQAARDIVSLLLTLIRPA
ncbi:MAG TPA: UDP-N-acetylglucosamine--N-acetylmuramyl-(pentapeptide) pyrophosphoryl-undecaprenol N-acetylglucosamine transferase [Gemmatimonadales bacterium]|nr:UDP-N-acetylglucosamine--N-acetylmuramyl-(pentapeptide) pyrophosphoryl-undecaprenol N-acetylglucosamine transferase [Gemmatimonadales bacterium]